MVTSLVLTFYINTILVNKVGHVTDIDRVIIPFVTITCFMFTLVLVVYGVAGIPTTIIAIIRNTFRPHTIANNIMNDVFITVRGNITENVFSGRTKLNDTPVTTTTTRARRPIHRKLIDVANAFVSAVIVYALAKLSVMLAKT